MAVSFGKKATDCKSMPVLRCGSEMPAWSEVKKIEISSLKSNEEKSIRLTEMKEDFFVTRGQCRISCQGKTGDGKIGGRFSYRCTDTEIRLSDAVEGTELVRIGGNWGDVCGDAGLFTLTNSSQPRNDGDPVSYRRTTEFDNHYHDCDEFWIILEGSGRVVTEGRTYDVSPGDCVATRMGDHHDFPEVFAPVRGIFFESTLKGPKRKGHLWNHSHNRV